jgi:hypothetical protein
LASIYAAIEYDFRLITDWPPRLAQLFVLMLGLPWVQYKLLKGRNSSLSPAKATSRMWFLGRFKHITFAACIGFVSSPPLPLSQVVIGSFLRALGMTQWTC